MSKQIRLERPKDIRIIESEPVRPGTGEAWVRLRVGGICGSDVAAYRGVSPLVSYPRVLGHELVVDVVEAPGKPALVGQRAVVEPLLSCGICKACRQGRYNCCTRLQVMGVHVDGGLRETMVIPNKLLHPVPEDLPDDLAVLAEPMSIAYRSVQRSAIEPGQVAVIFGAGTIGILIARLLVRGRGCRAFVVDIDTARLQVAESAGATPLRGSPETLIQELKAATHGDMADVVFEATGSAACTRLTTDLVAFAGKIVLIGWNQGPVEVDTVTLMRKEVDLLGSRNSRNAFPAVLRLLADGVVDHSQVITHRYGFEDASAALSMLDQGKEPALKALIYPPGS